MSIGVRHAPFRHNSADRRRYLISQQKGQMLWAKQLTAQTQGSQAWVPRFVKWILKLPIGYSVLNYVIELELVRGRYNHRSLFLFFFQANQPQHTSQEEGMGDISSLLNLHTEPA